MGDIYQSLSSFRAEVGGQDVTVRRGDTVREGHPLLAAHPDSFRLLKPRFEHTPSEPTPTPEAPVKRPAPKAPPLKVPAAKKVDEEA